MAIERTFSIIKPDATKRNLTGKIIRQLPLPPRDAALERPRSGRGDSILPLLPIALLSLIVCRPSDSQL